MSWAAFLEPLCVLCSSSHPMHACMLQRRHAYLGQEHDFGPCSNLFSNLQLLKILVKSIQSRGLWRDLRLLIRFPDNASRCPDPGERQRGGREGAGHLHPGQHRGWGLGEVLHHVQ